MNAPMMVESRLRSARRPPIRLPMVRPTPIASSAGDAMRREAGDLFEQRRDGGEEAEHAD